MPLMLHPGHFGRDWSSSSLFPLMLPPSHRERGTGIGRRVVSNLCCFTTNAVDWVVRRSNHRAVPSSATTGPDLLVPAPRHGNLFAVPRLAPSGTASTRFQGPRAQFIDLEVVGLLSTSCHRTLQFTVMLDVSSLTSWWTFRAVRTVPGRDVLVAVALASCARESRELVRDVSYHGRTSAGRTHRYSVSS
jgi:hypothetical protein